MVVHTGQGLEGNGILPSNQPRMGPALIGVSRTDHFPFGLAKLVHRKLQGNPFIEKLLKLVSIHSVCTVVHLSKCFMSWYSQLLRQDKSRDRF